MSIPAPLNNEAFKKKKRAFQIIDQAKMLRGPDSLFLSPAKTNDFSENSQPRALRGLARIIDGGLCHRCGTCIGICPTKVLAKDQEDYPYVQNLSACTDCDLCVKVCPGDEFDFKRNHQRVFGEAGEIADTHGHFSEASIAYASDPQIQQRSTSGGLVTAILLYLIESRKIDGALVIVSDEEELWRGKPLIARNREQILAAMKSKYAISPTNELFSEIRSMPGKYAIVGLPCQIHGFRKAVELDKRLAERIVLAIGLFCHAAIEHDALRIIWDSLGEYKERAISYISRVGKHPGTPHIQLDDGSLRPVYFPEKKWYRPTSMEIINIVYRLYTPKRCLTCFDALAEFADIAIGDPWLAPPHNGVDFSKGWSFALIRTKIGEKIYKDALQAGYFAEEKITKREALACNTMMAGEKRHRAFRSIETLKRQGKPIPAYGEFGFSLPSQSGIQFVKTEIHMLTHVFCYLPKLRAPVLKFFLSNWGYIPLWLNHKRRYLRTFLRDQKTSLLNKFFGRR
ncbi:MAG TPA: Coenzyme F420 hydrogenase/dehydrogenase, beta subunit C-terminal domain [Oligoflexia bacterium]|nr:Coenzyme F420 hydrogenase/dehydrogenase, beta subunit C-terminal domain [Oligoflexia bacterium]HMP27714.1 Coenzyme F420 hydrogenase/dehydrogenase, beta subunit C-terminal domain [Oligoflexia bacterium]